MRLRQWSAGVPAGRSRSRSRQPRLHLYCPSMPYRHVAISRASNADGRRPRNCDDVASPGCWSRWAGSLRSRTSSRTMHTLSCHCSAANVEAYREGHEWVCHSWPHQLSPRVSSLLTLTTRQDSIGNPIGSIVAPYRRLTSPLCRACRHRPVPPAPEAAIDGSTVECENAFPSSIPSTPVC